MFRTYGPNLPGKAHAEVLQSNFIEITLRHGCLPVNLLYIFRTLTASVKCYPLSHFQNKAKSKNLSQNFCLFDLPLTLPITSMSKVSLLRNGLGEQCRPDTCSSFATSVGIDGILYGTNTSRNK